MTEKTIGHLGDGPSTYRASIHPRRRVIGSLLSTVVEHSCV